MRHRSQERSEPERWSLQTAAQAPESSKEHVLNDDEAKVDVALVVLKQEVEDQAELAAGVMVIVNV